MIEQASYEGVLIQKIRQEYGTERAVNRGYEGTPDASESLQSELRPGEPEGGQPIGDDREGRDGAERSEAGTNGYTKAPKRSYQRKGRANPEVDESNGGTRRNKQSTGNQVLGSGGIDEKPSGIEAKPNAREKRVRQEQVKAETARTAETAEDKKGIFGWLRSDNRTGKEAARSKPLSEKEAEEIREPLKAALADYFLYLDELIYATHKAHKQVSIWSSMDDEELDIIVNVWLAKAKRNVKSARNISMAVNKHMELKVGLILAPRFYQTFRAYVDGGGFGVR